MQMALGLQAGGANLTWSRMLPQNPLKMWDSNPLSQPPQTCAAKPPQKPEVEPPQKEPSASQKIAPGRFLNPGQFFGSFDALGFRSQLSTSILHQANREYFMDC